MFVNGSNSMEQTLWARDTQDSVLKYVLPNWDDTIEIRSWEIAWH